MADETSRYDVEVKLTVTDRTTGETVPEFGDVILHQYNLKYEDMNDLQWDVVQAVSAALKPVSDARAEEIKGKRGQGQTKQEEKFAR